MAEALGEFEGFNIYPDPFQHEVRAALSANKKKGRQDKDGIHEAWLMNRFEHTDTSMCATVSKFEEKCLKLFEQCVVVMEMWK